MPRLLASVLLIASLIAGCTPATPSSGGAISPQQGERRSENQVLRIAKTALPPGITPEASNVNNDTFNMVFDSLASFGENYTLRPAAAEKWEYTGTAWRFTIRPDLVFSNGEKVTADDVVFSITQLVERNWPTKSYLPTATGARKIDERVVEVVTRQPDMTVPNGAPWIYVLPQKYFESIGAKEFGLKPIGSGPYVLQSFTPNSGAVFTRRTETHPFRTPIATEVRFVVVPELTQQIVGLRTGELDFALSNFTTDQLNSAKSSGLQVVTRITSVTSALFSQPEAQARNSPLLDKRVRQAINYAVNKEAITNGYYGGYAKPAGQITIPGSPVWDDTLQPYPFDPAKAKQLLAEAGYPNGFKLPVGIGYTPATVPQDIPAIIQANLRDVGIEASLNGQELAVFLDKYYGRGVQKDDLFLQTAGDPNGTYAIGRGLYDCAKEGFALWWCNRDFNRLYDLAVHEADPARRAALMREANRALVSDVPALFLFVRDGTAVMSPKIRGFEWPSPVQYTYDTVYRVD
ncbi:MAG: diguanylate phosphodiesterase [Dehalococcoidia bacterium]|nr:MAG: diguanylate phosphodiesterase [Dehalococcoidia bacterium]